MHVAEDRGCDGINLCHLWLKLRVLRRSWDSPFLRRQAKSRSTRCNELPAGDFPSEQVPRDERWRRLGVYYKRKVTLVYFQDLYIVGLGNQRRLERERRVSTLYRYDEKQG